MKREWTNRIRFVLDELIPPVLRDARWFMWPFFVAAYGSFSVSKFMDFKSKAYTMSDDEYAAFYGSLGNSVSRKRTTDLNDASVQFLIKKIQSCNGESFLDVGAGNGYLIEKVKNTGKFGRVAGVDVAPSKINLVSYESFTGALPNLPFADHEFDVVTCTHVMEHLLDPLAAAKELVRVARNLVLVVVPRQRYYFYTLDEHLNFYPEVEPLVRLFYPCAVSSFLLDGDWLIVIDPKLVLLLQNE